MRKPLLFAAAVLFLLSAPLTSIAGDPDLGELKLVAQLPPDLPQRIMGIAYDGEKLWVSIYHGGGLYATLDPSTLGWALSDEKEHYQVVGNVAGSFQSPGGICFAKGMLWVTGSYGDSFGSIDTQTWKVQQLFKGKQRDDGTASQAYSSVAYDGNHLWIAWHWFKYDLPVSQTQLLLKVDPENGKVVGQYPAPGGTRTDVTHGLTWDGTRLWHVKGHRLSSIEPSTGVITGRYVINEIRRPSGLAWANDALWIAEFGGKVWRLPFK